jgi:hypothetical protein
MPRELGTEEARPFWMDPGRTGVERTGAYLPLPVKKV